MMHLTKSPKNDKWGAMSNQYHNRQYRMTGLDHRCPGMADYQICEMAYGDIKRHVTRWDLLKIQWYLRNNGTEDYNGQILLVPNIKYCPWCGKQLRNINVTLDDD